MTVRAFVLSLVAGLCLTSQSPAQLAAAPPEADQSERLRQTHEDMAVFRMLFNRTVSRYFNFPTGGGRHAEIAHTPPSAEGVYLKGQGIIYTAGLPTPATHPVKKSAAAPADNSAWERARLELRGEKPVAETKPGETSTKSLSEVFLTLLAENGQHFKHLAGEERVTIAVTLRSGQDCARCHAAATDRSGAANRVPAHMMYRTTVLDSPAGQGGPPSPPSRTETAPVVAEGQADIQLGDLALKQKRFSEAEEAYMRAFHRLSDSRLAAGDLRRIVLAAEVANKLAQCYLGLGQTDKAKHAMEVAEKYSQTAVKLADKGGKGKMPPLPAQLIVSATKAQLDQVAGRKISFEEFTKAVTVEYRTFDQDEKKDGMK